MLPSYGVEDKSVNLSGFLVMDKTFKVLDDAHKRIALRFGID